MNKLLRNPWLVSALVIGMAAIWWVQLRHILLPGGAAESPAPTLTSANSATENLPVDTDTNAPLRVLSPRLANQLRWDNTPSRDPFGPPTSLAPANKEPQITVAPEPVLPVTAPTPALAAVLNTPSAHIAVIDGRIVRVGDKVSGRAVLSIDNTAVALGRSVDESLPLVLKLPLR